MQSNEYPTLPEGWTVKPLIDCTSDRVISYGIVQPGNNTDDGIPVIRVNNFTDTGLDLSNVLRVAPSIEEKYSRTRLQGGEVLLTLVGSTGQSIVAPNALKGWNVPRAIAVIRPSDDIGPSWINICLQSEATKHYLDSRANTTVQKTLNLQDVRQIPVPLPPRDTKTFIENIIGTLDDKIELNRQMNETLEAMAQALFKSWFVDFDPVIDNALAAGNEIPEPLQKRTAARQALGDQRKPLPADIQSLFPDRFVFTDEMGWIPHGWSQSSIYSLIDIVYGAPFKSSLFNEDKMGLPIIRIRDLKTGTPQVFSEELHPKGTKIKRGSLLVGMDAEFRPTIWMGETGWINQRVFLAQPVKEADSFFIQNVLSPLLAHEENAQVGTTVAHLGKKDIDKFVWLEPSETLISAYTRIAKPMLERWMNIHAQSVKLAALRDTLLPKLLSGELRIPDAEKQVAEAV